MKKSIRDNKLFIKEGKYDRSIIIQLSKINCTICNKSSTDGVFIDSSNDEYSSINLCSECLISLSKNIIPKE